MTSARSSRFTILIVVLVLVGIGVALYSSPKSGSALERVLPRPTVTAHATETSTAKASTVVPAPSSWLPTVPSTTHPTTTTPKATPSAKATVVASDDGGAQSVLNSDVSLTNPVPTPECSQFKYQQDAQAAYLANVSDPGGLDGAPGPFNGDGIACSQLPVDSSRAASSSVGAYVPAAASAALKQSIMSPTGKYYGLTLDGAPFSTTKLDALNAEIGKTPAVLQFFTNWDQTASAAAAGNNGAFRADGVKAAWARGALPVITWQSQDSGFLPASGQDRISQPAYQLSKITSGTYDSYIRQFAISVVQTNLPVVIRLDQEMNGTFYPWSEGLNGNQTGDYVAMWRHVWNIFQSVGANDDVIWEWAPNRVDQLGAAQNTFATFSSYYPGDQYVDWLALDAYWRTSTTPTDWDTTFGKSISLLEQLSSTKKIFLAEVGATQQDSQGNDLTSHKTAWIKRMVAGVLADPQIVGFAYFDNIAQNTNGSTLVTNDWRLEAAPAVLSAFAGLVAPPSFIGGLTLDGSTVVAK